MMIKNVVRFVVCAAALTTVKMFGQVENFHLASTNTGGTWSVGVPATVTQQGTLRFTNAGIHTIEVTITGQMRHSGSGGTVPVDSTITLGNVTIVSGSGAVGKEGNTVIVGASTTITMPFTSTAQLTATTTGTVTVTGRAEAKPDGSSPSPAEGSGSATIKPPEDDVPNEEEQN